jgi:hypothetical protein
LRPSGRPREGFGSSQSTSTIESKEQPMSAVVHRLAALALLATISACGSVEEGGRDGGGGGNEDDGAEVEDAGTGSEDAGDPDVDAGAGCESGANGFVDIPDTLRGDVANQVDVGSSGAARVILYFGNVSGDERGWAMLEGATREGDTVWMDWTQNGGDDWLRCGPFEVTEDGATRTTPAQRTSNSSDWQFRACAQTEGVDPVCGAWW